MSSVDSQPLVITDANERTPKVHWDEAPSGAAFTGAIDWDDRWADHSQAQPGEYLAWVKAADAAGNEGVKLGKVSIAQPFNPFSLILPPTRTPQPTAVVVKRQVKCAPL